MKLSTIILTAILILGCTYMSYATIEASSSTPTVDPTGAAEPVGMLRLVFSGPEFGDGDIYASTDYFVVVRIHMTDGVKLVSVGGLTSDQVTPSNYIPLAVEADCGVPFFSSDPSMVRIVRFTSDFLDVLFCKDMYSYTINASNRVRISFGLPANTVPTSNNSNLALGEQPSTLLVCDFSQTERDFNTDSFWEVGVTAYHSDYQGNLGASYNAAFSPSRVPLAQVNQAQVGDLNLDGALNAADLVLMANFLSHNINLLPYIQ